MALEKLEPLLRVLVWPRSALKRMSAAPFGVADVFAGRLAGNASDASDGPTEAPKENGGNLFNSAQWKRQYGFHYISSALDFITFQEDGTVKMGAAGVGTGEGAGGFLLKARASIHNAVIHDTTSFELPPNLETMKCQKISGEWSERLPDTRPRASAIYLQKPEPNHSAEAWSGELERNQGFVLSIEWVGTASQHIPDCGFRITLPGGRYSIVFRQNGKNADAKVELQKRTLDKWDTARRLTEGDPVRFSGRTTVTSAVVGGRWVVGINGQGWHLADAQQPADWKQGMPMEAAGWPAGRLKFTAYGVQPCIQILTTRYFDDEDKPLTAIVQRIVKDIPPRNNYGVVGTCVRGYKAEGTDLTIDAEGNRNIVYTVRLTASPDGLATPIATAAGIQLPAEMEQVAADPIDLRPYITSWDFTSAEPGVIGASDFNCQLDRTRLARKIPDWEEKIQQFSQITVELGWRYVDPAFGTLYDGPLEPLLRGYILNPDRDLKDYLGLGMPLVCRDEILRIQEPAGFVDERFSALDILFDKGVFADLHGGDCIKYLLGLQLGEEVAAGINGTGNAMAFFPPTHFSLLSRTGQGYFVFAKPAGGDAFRLPPPYGEALQSWFSTIAGYDYAVLYYGRSPLNPTGPPCFIYGRTQEICRAWEAVYGGVPLELPDRIYVAGDSARLLGSASLKFRPEKAYNDFVAWGSGDISDSARPYQPGYPATMGRALLPRSDANAADYSWRRTLLLKQEYLDRQPGTAQNLASRVEAEFEGVDVFTATLVLPRGDETLRWGRKVKPKLPSDPTGKLDGQTLRILRVAHKGSFSHETAPDQKFTTELTVRPISGTGM